MNFMNWYIGYKSLGFKPIHLEVVIVPLGLPIYGYRSNNGRKAAHKYYTPLSARVNIAIKWEHSYNGK